MNGHRAPALPDLDTVLTPDGATLRLERSWPRSPDHLLLELATDGGERVAAQWWRAPGRAAAVASATPGSVQVDGHLLLHPSGADRRLVGLRRLLEDPLAALVVHRPERRAVVRLAGSPPSWLKLVRPERVRDLTGRAGTSIACVRTPTLLEVDAERGASRWTHVPGRTLHELLATGSADGAVRAVRSTGRCAAAVHSSRPPVDGLPVHGPREEAAVLATWVGRLADHVPGLVAGVDAAMAPVSAGLAELGPARERVIHRDLHDKQVLLDPGGTGLVDLDTLALGDPELDVANLATHLTLRSLQGLCSLADATRLRRELLSAYGDALDEERLLAYGAAAQLRLACVYAFRPRWRHLSADLASRAASTAGLTAPCPVAPPTGG